MSKARNPWSTRAGQARVWMMPRDSDFAFVYWEVDEASVSTARAQLERLDVKTQLVLRVRCSGREHFAGAGARVLELPVEAWVGERYVPLGPAGHEHFCSIGLRTLDSEQGLFVPIARSSRVVSPLRSPSLHMSERPA